MIWEKVGTPAQDPDPLELEHDDEKLDECLTGTFEYCTVERFSLGAPGVHSNVGFILINVVVHALAGRLCAFSPLVPAVLQAAAGWSSAAGCWPSAARVVLKAESCCAMV